MRAKRLSGSVCICKQATLRNYFRTHYWDDQERITFTQIWIAYEVPEAKINNSKDHWLPALEKDCVWLYKSGATTVNVLLSQDWATHRFPDYKSSFQTTRAWWCADPRGPNIHMEVQGLHPQWGKPHWAGIEFAWARSIPLLSYQHNERNVGKQAGKCIAQLWTGGLEARKETGRNFRHLQASKVSRYPTVNGIWCLICMTESWFGV